MYGGNPSGCFFTTILNTFGQLILYCLFWMDESPPMVRDLYYFDLLVRVFLYGDDGILAVATSIHSWFNYESLRDYFGQYGMFLTSAAKDGGSSFRPIKELTFLKRAFRSDSRGMMVPKLSWDSLCTMLNWNRKSKYQTSSQTFEINVRQFVQFMYFYGMEDYNKWTKFLQLDTPSWQYYDSLFYGKQSFPYLFSQ